MTANERKMGLFDATTLGVGAIVGGGILALAGVAFAASGPSAILAFALNGIIAAIVATSFARLVRQFPESGGLYTYAKKVLSIEVAFVVGWVVWFASIVAGVLYALGFAAFTVEAVSRALQIAGRPAGWIQNPLLGIVVAISSVGVYTLDLGRRAGGRGTAATVGKVVVFAILIGAGAWAWILGESGNATGSLTPFFVGGPIGLVQAMGYTFIALQGFDLIPAVAGDVHDAPKTVPRAMYGSLALALGIYLPLLGLMSTAGAPPEGIAAAAAANPEGLVAEAAGRFVGPFGYWLVITAGILSMLSALRANLLAASHVAFSMARDQTLPSQLARMRGASGTPALAIGLTGFMVAAIVVAVGNVAAAGAAASLIFLVSFAMAHWTAILANKRTGDSQSIVLPLVGAVLCLALAAFQAFAVPAAGSVVVGWLVLGLALYLTIFASGARLVDVRAEARDPDLARLRGRTPLVLVPIANPTSAAGLVDFAATLRTPGVGRVLLLSILSSRKENGPGSDRALRDAQSVLEASLRRGLEDSLSAESLFTIAPDVWAEISRVGRLHHCETVLLGLSDLSKPDLEARLETLVDTLESDVVVLRAPQGWKIADAQRVLIPLGGRGHHSRLRTRLIASLARSRERSLTFLGTIRPDATPESRRRFERALRALAQDEAVGAHQVQIEVAEHPLDAIIGGAAASDLVIMGMHRHGRNGRALGQLSLTLGRRTHVPFVLIG